VAGYAGGETAEIGQTPQGQYASAGFKSMIVGYTPGSSIQNFLAKVLHASTVM
jgi:hypothetical protein